MSRDLRLLAGAVFLSAAGDLLALVVLALQVHELTGSGLAVSALFATTLVPVVTLAPLAGLVADRVESVRVLVVASLAQAVVAGALAFSGEPAAILALATLLAAGGAFAQPAEFTLVPAVAGERGVAGATGVVEAARYAGFTAGPLLAAGLVALGPRPALLVNAASFVAVAAAAATLRARRPAAVGEAHARPRALDGARVLHGDRTLRVALGAAVGALLFISASLTVEVFYVKDVVGASDAAYALLLCAWTAGMVAGATALARRVPARLAAGAALVALAVQGAGMGVQAAWAILPVAFAGYVVGGVGHGVKNVLLRTLIAARVPVALHGRAFAAYNAARNAAELGAIGAGGLLVGVLGPRAALVLAALGPIVAAAAGLALLARRRITSRPKEMNMETTTLRHRAVTRLLLPAAAACATAAAMLPASADAGVLTRLPGSEQLTLLAAPGEVNRVRVADDGPGFVRVRDEHPLADDTNRCTAVSRVELRCPAQSTTTSVVLRLLDGADRAEVASTLRVGVEGGAGNDTYAGGVAPGPSRVLFRGGADFDTASFFDATAGVTVRLGDGPGDGRAGDGDEIADAERVIGSRFGDGLDASRAQPSVGAELDGGMGIDILTGGEQRDVLVSGPGGDFLSGRGGVDRLVAADGDRDTVDCGGGTPDEALVSVAGERTVSGCERVIPVRPPATNTGGGLVGTLRLAPAALRVAAGEPARLRLSWRHPEGWRKLRRVELRLRRGDAGVGTVRIRARDGRMTSAGAVRLVRGASGVVRARRTVSARLALRLDRSLAGRRLRIDVEAVDVRGARQLERGAGAIRVAG